MSGDVVSTLGSGRGTLVAVAADLRDRLGLRVRLDEPMAGHTTMRVGGPADVFVAARSTTELVEIAGAARASSVPWVVLGRGSDLVVADDGIRGLVVLCRAETHHIEGERLVADAGLPLARAATVAQRAGLAGLEFGLAIPGTVGGAVWANAGAHGTDVAAVLEVATILLLDGTRHTETPQDLGLAYRDSRLKHAGGLVLDATFHLRPEAPAVIERRLADIRQWRREHQPLKLPSAGSVFRNPEGDSAGRLIEACGLKSRRAGGASISEKHANFIVNDGGASASDVRRLAEEARSAVAARFGIELVYEVQFIGDWSNWKREAR